MILEGYAFVALSTTDLERARRFWVDQLEFPVVDEQSQQSFVVDAGSLHLRVDIADGDARRPGSTDPIIGFRVASLAETLAGLATRDVYAHRGPVEGPSGVYAELRDPDGRAIFLAESE